MGLKAAVQALKKAEELKARVSRHDDLLNNSEVWSDQQQLQTVYHQVLVLDLEYALDKKVEQELWTLGFKNHIGALQHLSKDKKNPKRSEYQALLSWCLEAASGFYLTLLQELCTTFELDLPFRRRGSIYGQTKTSSISTVNFYHTTVEQFTQPHKSSCLYICQYCLVHLGDIARYRSQRKQAESFYQHAILLSPSSGQPYNQLALLEASRGDKLATVFHYVRSISVKHPFPAAATNLSHTLSAVIDHNPEPITEIHSKLSIMEFLTMFLRVHGLLHLAIDLDQAELYVKSLNATFTALVATNAFSSIKLIQMTAINLYALRYTLDSVLTVEQLTSDELRVKNLILDLLAGGFSAYLLPIYTMPNDSTLLDYYALPAIKLTLDWIKTDPSVLKESVFMKRLQIWPSLCKLLNVLQLQQQTTLNGDCDVKNFEKIPLPEDRDLQCFLPLANAYKELDFTMCVNPNHDSKFFNNLRVTRLINLSIYLSMQHVNNNVFIISKKTTNPNNVIFEPCIQQPDPTTDLLNELKHFNVKDNNKEAQNSSLKVSIEKRNGILKPQGSLEKAREEREQALILSSSSSSSTNIPISCVTEVYEPNNATSATSAISSASRGSSTTSSIGDATKFHKRNRQNVAMQTLAKKVEENNSKQVTFVTEQPTVNKQPSLNPNFAVKTKAINFDSIGTVDVQQKQNSMNPFQNQVAHSMAYKSSVPFQNVALPISNMYPMSSTFQNSVPATNYHSVMQQTTSTTNAPYHSRQYNQSAFDLNLPQQQQQQQQSDHQSFKHWLHDDKLPMPPSTWTSWPHNNSKPMMLQQQQRQFPPPPPMPAASSNNIPQNDLFHQNYSYNNTNTTACLNNYIQDNVMPQIVNYDNNNRHHQTTNSDIGTSTSNNSNNNNNAMSLWNSGPNFQPNLQMIFNHQQSTSTMKQNNSTQAPLYTDSIMPETQHQATNPTVPSGSYSLFNSNWPPNLTVQSSLKYSNQKPPERSTTAPPLMRQQSLFSGPGPSPLERLLQQQKQQRGCTITITPKEDT